MRRAALFVPVLAIAACGGGTSRAPAWPKASAHEDGGESLAPRVAASIAAIEKADVEVKVDDKPAVKPDEPAKTTTGAPPSLPTVTAPDDVLTTEDIVIEIDD